MNDAGIKVILERILREHNVDKPELLLDLFLTVSTWVDSARLEEAKKVIDSRWEER